MGTHKVNPVGGLYYVPIGAGTSVYQSGQPINVLGKSEYPAPPNHGPYVNEIQNDFSFELPVDLKDFNQSNVKGMLMARHQQHMQQQLQLQHQQLQCQLQQQQFIQRQFLQQQQMQQQQMQQQRVDQRNFSSHFHQDHSMQRIPHEPIGRAPLHHSHSCQQTLAPNSRSKQPTTHLFCSICMAVLTDFSRKWDATPEHYVWLLHLLCRKCLPIFRTLPMVNCSTFVHPNSNVELLKVQLAPGAFMEALQYGKALKADPFLPSFTDGLSVYEPNNPTKSNATSQSMTSSSIALPNGTEMLHAQPKLDQPLKNDVPCHAAPLKSIDSYSQRCIEQPLLMVPPIKPVFVLDHGPWKSTSHDHHPGNHLLASAASEFQGSLGESGNCPSTSFSSKQMLWEDITMIRPPVSHQLFGSEKDHLEGIFVPNFNLVDDACFALQNPLHPFVIRKSTTFTNSSFKQILKPVRPYFKPIRQRIVRRFHSTRTFIVLYRGYFNSN
jgi:hypothetical protein